MDAAGPEAGQLLDRLVRAVNEHDIEALVDCFTDDYRNETPAHPQRGFVGREQVRRNWTQIFTAVPGICARVPRSTVAGDALWTEWDLSGTRPDGTAVALRGVVIFTVAGGRAAAATFYLEPVEHSSGDADAALRQVVGNAQEAS